MNSAHIVRPLFSSDSQVLGHAQPYVAVDTNQGRLVRIVGSSRVIFEILLVLESLMLIYSF